MFDEKYAEERHPSAAYLLVILIADDLGCVDVDPDVFHGHVSPLAGRLELLVLDTLHRWAVRILDLQPALRRRYS